MPLSDKQSAACRAGRYARVIAGPGSGKTTLLVARTKHLLDQNPEAKIALVTFAAPAAREMRDRLMKQMSLERVEVGTFDAFARRQVLDWINGRRPPNGAISRKLIEAALHDVELGLDPKEAPLHITRLDALPDPTTHPDESLVRLYTRYEERVLDEGYITFAMIAREAVKRLRAGTVAPLAVTSLLCDEFQDTAPMQLAWLKAHWEAGIDVTVVGDDDQSIYGFRASMGHIGMDQFAAATLADDFMLDDCYRCAPEIVDAAGRLIKNNTGRIPKKICSRADIRGDVFFQRFEERDREFDAMVKFIDYWQANGKDGDVAILTRTNLDIDVIEGVLNELEIETERLSTTSIWDSEAGSVVLAMAEFVVNPCKELLGNLAFVLRWMGVSESEISEYRAIVEEEGLGTHIDGEISEQAAIAEIHMLVPQLVQLNRSREYEQVLTSIELYLQRQGIPEGHKKRISKACEFLLPSVFSNQSLAQKIRNVTRRSQTPDGQIAEGEPTKAPPVQLGTLHSAKGKEWEAVWMTKCEETVIPSKHAIYDEHDGNIAGIEEERRLFYVGMTRAKRALRLAGTPPMSRFVGEAGVSPVPKGHPS